MPKAIKIRPKKEDRLRGDIPHQKRTGFEQAADMGGDESHLRPGGGGENQGIPSQSAASLCQDLLPGLPGCGPAGGCFGALQHRDDTDLPHLQRGGTRQTAGAVGTHLLI